MSSVSLNKPIQENIEHEYGHVEPGESRLPLVSQPAPDDAVLRESIKPLAARPAPECEVLDENLRVFVAQRAPENNEELSESLIALVAQLAPEDRARCAQFVDLLISARGDELAHRALRRVTALEEMIAILERRLKVGGPFGPASSSGDKKKSS